MEGLFSEPARERMISQTKLLHDTLVKNFEFEPQYNLTMSNLKKQDYQLFSDDPYALSVLNSYKEVGEARERVELEKQVKVEVKKEVKEEAKREIKSIKDEVLGLSNAGKASSLQV